MHDVLVQRDRIEAEVRRGELLPLKASTPDVLEAARDLLAVVEDAISAIAELEDFGEEWPLNLRIRCRQATFAPERGALESLFADLDALIDARSDFLKAPVSFPDEGLRSAKTLEAVTRAAENERPFSFISVGPGIAKEHIALIRIAGRAPSSTEDWVHVQRYLRLHD